MNNIEKTFPPKKPSHQKPSPDSEFAPDRNFYEKENNERNEARDEFRKFLHEKIKKERLSRPQNILINERQLKKIKAGGEINIAGIVFSDREIIPGEKVILSADNEEIEAELVKIIGNPTKTGTVTVNVRLRK